MDQRHNLELAESVLQKIHQNNFVFSKKIFLDGLADMAKINNYNNQICITKNFSQEKKECLTGRNSILK